MPKKKGKIEATLGFTLYPETGKSTIINKTNPWTVFINYKWIIDEIIKRNESIPDDVKKVLEDLDREQVMKKDAQNGK